MEYREIILFACGLTAKSQVMLDFLYQMYQEKYIKTGDQPDGEEFLRAACEEVSEWSGVKKIDPLHNQYLNFIDQHFNEVEFSPSRFYVFKPQNLYCGFQANLPKIRLSFRDLKPLPAECVIHAAGNNALEFSLMVVRKIANYQEVSISGLSVKDINTMYDEQLEGNTNTKAQLNEGSEEECLLESLTQKFNKTVHIRQNIRIVRMTHCPLSSSMYKHLAQELNGCSELEELMLQNAGVVPLELGKALSTAKSLKRVEVVSCNMLPSVSQHVLKGLSLCSELNTVRLTGNRLSSCVEAFVARCFPEMTTLDISRTELSEKDMVSLSQAFHQGKLSQLKKLDLSYNCLKDRIGILFGETLCKDLPDYNSMETLNLTRTELSTEDIVNLSQVMRIHNLPALKDLDLSQNCLTHDIGEMMTGIAELTMLESLGLADTKLAKDDLRQISDTLKARKLSHLQELNLQRNDLYLLQDGVEHLIESCKRKLTSEEMAKQVIKDNKLHIDFGNNNFSSEFIEEMEKTCRATTIHLGKKKKTWCPYCNILGEDGLFSEIVSIIRPIFFPRNTGGARRSNTSADDALRLGIEHITDTDFVSD